MSRFFFALWPDDTIREAILNCRSSLALSGRMTDKANLHVTLVFLGQLNVNQLQNIIKQAEQIVCPPFECCLTRTGYFKHSKAAWLGMKLIPETLSDLHQQLLSAADNSHIPIKQQTYRPHVTLARKAAPISTQAIAPITWFVRDFVLLESIDSVKGVHYRAIKYFTCI